MTSYMCQRANTGESYIFYFGIYTRCCFNSDCYGTAYITGLLNPRFTGGKLLSCLIVKCSWCKIIPPNFIEISWGSFLQHVLQATCWHTIHETAPVPSLFPDIFNKVLGENNYQPRRLTNKIGFFHRIICKKCLNSISRSTANRQCCVLMC